MVQNRQKVNLNFFEGPFFKVNFLKNYMSNAAQTKPNKRILLKSAFT